MKTKGKNSELKMSKWYPESGNFFTLLGEGDLPGALAQVESADVV